MAKQPATKAGAEYPANWSTMTREERDQWEQQNLGRKPRAAAQPAKPATRKTEPPAVPVVPVWDGEGPVEEDGGGLLLDGSESFQVETEALGRAVDGMTGADVLRCILRGLEKALRPDG